MSKGAIRTPQLLHDPAAFLAGRISSWRANLETLILLVCAAAAILVGAWWGGLR